MNLSHFHFYFLPKPTDGNNDKITTKIAPVPSFYALLLWILCMSHKRLTQSMD